MLSRLRPRLTYANVVSTIALFVVLGGGAYAAGHQIGTDDIENEAVTTPKIAPGAVTNTRIAPEAVRTGRIRNGAVTGAKLFDGAVQTEKLQNGAVGTAKIQAQAVTNSRIALETIQTGRIADGAVDHAKLSSDARPRWAVVDRLGNLERSRGATDSERFDEGEYRVTFEREIQSCAYIAQVGGAEPGLHPSPATISATSSASDPQVVLVEIRAPDDLGLQNADFHLLVVC